MNIFSMDNHEYSAVGITGMDIPNEPWTAEDIKFWTGSPTYQPWKDVAAYFRDNKE